MFHLLTRLLFGSCAKTRDKSAFLPVDHHFQVCHSAQAPPLNRSPLIKHWNILERLSLCHDSPSLLFDQLALWSLGLLFYPGNITSFKMKQWLSCKANSVFHLWNSSVFSCWKLTGLPGGPLSPLSHRHTWACGHYQSEKNIIKSVQPLAILKRCWLPFKSYPFICNCTLWKKTEDKKMCQLRPSFIYSLSPTTLKYFKVSTFPLYLKTC